MDDKCCNEYFPRKEKCCFDTVLAVIILVLAFFIGILIGTLGVLSETLTVGVLVGLIIVFAVLAILRLVSIICCNMKC